MAFCQHIGDVLRPCTEGRGGGGGGGREKDCTDVFIEKRGRFRRSWTYILDVLKGLVRLKTKLCK